MSFPKHVEYVVVGAGIHGLSCAWRLGERLIAAGEDPDGRVIVIDKTGVAAGATGIAWRRENDAIEKLGMHVYKIVAQEDDWICEVAQKFNFELIIKCRIKV